jgi:hypothetical protein
VAHKKNIWFQIDKLVFLNFNLSGNDLYRLLIISKILGMTKWSCKWGKDHRYLFIFCISMNSQIGLINLKKGEIPWHRNARHTAALRAKSSMQFEILKGALWISKHISVRMGRILRDAVKPRERKRRERKNSLSSIVISF